MPELPEVETVKRILEKALVGSTIKDIEVLKKRIIHGDVEHFRSQLIGQTYTRISRVGKYLVFHLTNDLVILSHLRMEGKYIEIDHDQPLSRFARVVIHLSDGRRICYDDSRQFGTMELRTEQDYLSSKSLTVLGDEPFNIDKETFYKRIKKTNKTIKEAILDQSIITGLGNIYADEVLYITKIHPRFPAKLLTREQTDAIVDQSIVVLNKAIAAGGSTIRSYQSARGVTGYFQQQLLAYGRHYQTCEICNHKFKKIRVGGRGTTYCPYCQVDHTVPIIIGVTGPIAAGKSTVAKALASEGYPLLSADAIVHQLYEDIDVIKKIDDEFKLGLDLEDKPDMRAILRKVVHEDNKAKSRLEKLIHPLVKEKMIAEISTLNSHYVIVEVPLLFESRMEEMFQYVIGVIADENVRYQLLIKRGDDPSIMLDINASNRFNRYVDKLDYLIVNDGSEAELKEKAHNVFAQIKKK